LKNPITKKGLVKWLKVKALSSKLLYLKKEKQIQMPIVKTRRTGKASQGYKLGLPKGNVQSNIQN
jgi:hypothetical protein